MRYRRTAVGGLAGVMLLSTGAAAQAGAWVLPPGTARIGVESEFSHWRGELGPLPASGLVPLPELRSQLEEFMAASGGGAVDPDQLTLGEAALSIRSDSRRVPLTLAVGVLPRVEIGVSLPVHRAEVQVSRFLLADALLGANPDADANAAAFAALGPQFEALGRARFLPLAGSPLGIELASRLAGGENELVLPTTPVADSLLNLALAEQLGIVPLRTHQSPWLAGDAEVTLRVRLLSSMGAAPLPTGESAIDYRLTGQAGVRLPTGSGPDSLLLHHASPEVGLTGWSGGLTGDLFIGRLGSVSGLVSYSSTGDTRIPRREALPAEPLDPSAPTRPSGWSPASEMRVRLSPRIRLARAISLGLDYEMLRLGDGSSGAPATGPDLLEVPGGTFQRMGASVRFTAVPAAVAGADVLPLEGLIAYSSGVSGPGEYAPVTSLRIRVRLFQRLWGR